MNELEIPEQINVKHMIYEIRGKQVMLDSDLAKLYQVETKRINEAVKNNPQKFPDKFSWKLTDDESHNFLVENFDQKIESRGGKYKNPRVFTEQGVYMLATILKSKVATVVTISIMDAFVQMKNYISNSLIENNYYKEMLLTHDRDIKILKEQFKTQNNHLFFEGQIYDAYSLLVDILTKAKEEIIIIDNYIDKNILDILKNINTKITIITNKYNNKDYDKYKEEYSNINLIVDNSFHDRFIILDNKTLYHCGASFKDLGKKCFGINKIENENILNNLLEIISFIET